MTDRIQSGSNWLLSDVHDYGIVFKRHNQFSDFFKKERPQLYGKMIKHEKLRKEIIDINFQGDYAEEVADLEKHPMVITNFCQKVETVVKYTGLVESAVDDLGKSIFQLLGFNRSRRHV